jgi:DNA-binding winged helix-turn-helix (wHTH) protein/TolB-like protein/Tfp pilus assembly protein PilF
MRHKSGYLYEFGPFVLDTDQHLLSRQGTAVSLTPKTYDTLLVLVENSGRMLTKEELMKALWPNSFVEESNLTQQVSMIRKALGESAGEDRYIVTVPGRGYRFAAEVRERHDEPTPIAKFRSTPEVVVDSKEVGTTVHTRATWRKQILRAALGLLAVGLVAALSYSVYRRQAIKGRASGGPRSLAILPFQSLREDAKSDFLGFSLADAVITKLGYVRSITVRPSSSIERYRNQVIDPRKVAAELHVDALLTGNFIRDGDDLRITSQLIDVPSDNILWKGTFDLKYDRLLSVQDSVARQIIKGLELSLSPVELERLRPDKHVDPLAYEYYLRGVDLYSQNEFPMAVKMLLKSSEIDSSYALTWAHLGRSYTANASFELGGREEYRKAQTAYERALSLQPEQIEAQIFMANLLTDTGRVEGAVPLLRKAMQTNPNHAEAHWELGYAYRFGGMLRESAAECEQARQLDPGVKLSSSTLNAYLYLGEYDKFLQSLPRTGDSSLMLFYRGFANYHRNDRDQAAKDLDAAFELRPSLLQARVGKALADAIRGQTSKGLKILHETEDKIAELGVGDPEAMYKIAQVYAALGDKASALRVLRHSIENGFFSYPYFVNDPLLETLHKDVAFTQIMALARQRHESFKRTFF